MSTHRWQCGDGYCLIGGPAKGQHTNGGCRCLLDLNPVEKRRAVQQALSERDQLRAEVERLKGNEAAYDANCEAWLAEIGPLRTLVGELVGAIDALDLPDGNVWSDYAHWPPLIARARAALGEGVKP